MDYDNFDSEESRNDWIEILQKIKLIFLIRNMFELSSYTGEFSSYEHKCIIDGASFANISKIVQLKHIQNQKNDLDFL